MARDRRTEGRLFEGEPRREVQDELEFHLEQRTREFMAAGMEEAAAARRSTRFPSGVQSPRCCCRRRLRW